MSRQYFETTGIDLWTDVRALPDALHTTITVLAMDESLPSHGWAELVTCLAPAPLEIVEWRTLGTRVAHSKLLELKTIRSLQQNFGAYCQIQKDRSTGALTYAKVSTHILPEDIDRLRDSRNGLLLIRAPAPAANDSLLAVLGRYHSGLEPQALVDLFALEPESIVIKFYPNETDEVLQIILAVGNRHARCRVADLLERLKIPLTAHRTHGS